MFLRQFLRHKEAGKYLFTRIIHTEFNWFDIWCCTARIYSHFIAATQRNAFSLALMRHLIFSSMEENIKCLIKAREKQEGSFWTRKVSKPAFKVHLANNNGSKYNTYTSESSKLWSSTTGLWILQNICIRACMVTKLIN